MIKFALCGNIASGKSTVQKFLECNGYKVLDTDCVAHKLLTVNSARILHSPLLFLLYPVNRYP